MERVDVESFAAAAFNSGDGERGLQTEHDRTGDILSARCADVLSDALSFTGIKSS